MNNQGFINTEIGCFPKGWSIICLGDYIVDINDGPFGSNLKTEHYTSKREVRIIQLGNVGDNGWNNDNVKYTTYEHAATLKRCIVPYGSVIIAKMMPAGRAILCPSSEPMYIQGSDVIKVSFSDAISKEFFIYLTKSKAYIDQIESSVQGSTRARTNIGKIKTLKLPLPPREEQDRIADALSSMDALIASLDEVIQKKRQIKEGLMQNLLTGSIRLRGFSGEWHERRLDSFEMVNGSMLKSSDYQNGAIPVIAGGKTPAGYHSVANRPSNTITISGSGAYAGFVSFHNHPIFASDCSTINNPRNADVKYLYFCLLSKQEEIYKCQAGGAQPHVHAKDIKDITIQMPDSFDEQREIAKILTNAEEEILRIELLRDKYSLIKQGMMQELLTGKTRL